MDEGKSSGRGEGKRHPLNMRTTKELREKIDRAAEQSGRSLVQEVEHRLERSFDEGDLLEKVFGGSDNVALFRVLSGVIAETEARTGKCWHSNEGARVETAARIMIAAVNYRRSRPVAEQLLEIVESPKLSLIRKVERLFFELIGSIGREESLQRRASEPD
jgi:hypothetical protein